MQVGTQTNSLVNLLDEQAVCAEMKALVEASEWDKLQALVEAHACAKQRQELATAEEAFLASLPPAKRARLVSIGRVNLGGIESACDALNN
jgi:hypothetical protein